MGATATNAISMRSLLCFDTNNPTENIDPTTVIEEMPGSTRKSQVFAAMNASPITNRLAAGSVFQIGSLFLELKANTAADKASRQNSIAPPFHGLIQPLPVITWGYSPMTNGPKMRMPRGMPKVQRRPLRTRTQVTNSNAMAAWRSRFTRRLASNQEVFLQGSNRASHMSNWTERASWLFKAMRIARERMLSPMVVTAGAPFFQASSRLQVGFFVSTR